MSMEVAAPVTVAGYPPAGVVGLTEAEARERRARGLGNDVALRSSRSYGQILRENVFTLINGIFFVLGLALILLGRVADALTTVGVVSFNLLVGVVQEVRAKRKLDQIALLNRPTATVLRDGQPRSLDPAEIVVGDAIAVGPGDQIVVDGVIVGDGRIEVDESLLTGESDLVPKAAGDPVYSGSFCVTGKAFYEAQTVGAECVASKLTAGARMFRRILTPLQRNVGTILRVILGIAVYLGLVQLTFSFINRTPLVDTVQRSVVIAGLVPNGLLVAIAMAYAFGAIRLARSGVLAQQANAIESLSNVDVLCLDKTGTLTANRLCLHAVHPFGMTEVELQALLGTFAACGSAGNTTSAAIAAAYPGATREVADEVPFASSHKWSALTFTEGLPARTYVLGAPEMLEPYLTPGTDVRGPAEAWAQQGLRVLLFAAYPEPATLRDAAGQPRLLPGLQPLGLVSLSDVLRPAARETLADFRRAGVTLKVISGDNPDTVAALAKQAGFPPDLTVISGPELAALDPAQFERAVRETTVFGRITPQQKEQIVRTLREGGSYVAMTGDGVNDVLSLKQAQIGIAMASGSQATRGVADLLLLDDSFAALPRAVQEGQRVVNGMRDTLMLFLTRITTVGLLILILSGATALSPRQSALLSLLTVGIPALAVAAWAEPGPVPRQSLLRRIASFVVPAAITLSLGAVLVYLAAADINYTLPPDTPAEIADPAWAAAEAIAQTTLLGFLVVGGILLLPFLEPPGRLWAAYTSPTGDPRLGLLAGALLVAYVAIQATPWGQASFDLSPLPLASVALIVGTTIVWLVLIQTIWRARLLDRTLGLQPSCHEVPEPALGGDTRP